MNLKLKHKRLYALLVVLCLVLSVAVLLTACKDKNKGDNDGGNTDRVAAQKADKKSRQNIWGNAEVFLRKFARKIWQP